MGCAPSQGINNWELNDSHSMKNKGVRSQPSPKSRFNGRRHLPLWLPW